MDGVRQVFAYAEGSEIFAAAAREAGVEHVVLLSSGSVLIPWAQHNAIAREHREAEHALSAAGLSCTPIRPLVLAGNALAWRHSIRRDGLVRVTNPDHRTAPLHERDIAAVAVAALTDVQKDRTGLLTGGELLTQREQFARFMPPPAVEAVLEFIREPSPITGTVEQLLGRPPIPFAQWAHEHAADYR